MLLILIFLRDFYHYLNSPKVRISNDKCKLQLDVRSDLVDPKIEVNFGKWIIFATKKVKTRVVIIFIFEI